jgi:hypothetical protein
MRSGELPFRLETLVMKIESEWVEVAPLPAEDAIERRAKEGEGSHDGRVANPTFEVMRSCSAYLLPRTEEGAQGEKQQKSIQC